MRHVASECGRRKPALRRSMTSDARMGRVAASACRSSASSGLPEIEPGDDLAALIAAAGDVVDGDVVVVTSKIVSKAEGAHRRARPTSTPSGFATEWATKWDKDPRVVELVLRESKRIVRMVGPVLITETHHGFVCANSGDRPVARAAPHGRVVAAARRTPTPRRAASASRFADARRRRRRHRQRHVRPAVARGPDRRRHRHRRHRPDAQLHRPGRSRTATSSGSRSCASSTSWPAPPSW